jgi:2-polyprenyl-3-methyl-5-hydroxy-6-metoxy-1,4-benzoquinol methylase
MTRELNKEFQDTENRKYAYDFDYILRDYMIESFKPFFKKNGSALEMGCYKGEFTKKILNHFDKITVIEGSSDLINEAQKNVQNTSKVTFVNKMFEEWIPDQKYDSIFLLHTLEHLEDPIKILTKIKSAISPDGYLFLVVPNADAASRQIAVNMNIISHNAAVTEAEHEHGHRITYSFDTLQRDVSKAGLEVVNKSGIFFKPFANFQFDKIIESKIIDQNYLDGCYKLGFKYPDLCASIFFLCR